MMAFKRITISDNQMGRLACIPGVRSRVATIVSTVAEWMAEAEILAAYPDL